MARSLPDSWHQRLNLLRTAFSNRPKKAQAALPKSRLPADLHPVHVTGPKRTWTLEQVFNNNQLSQLKRILLSKLPRDAEPSPTTRVLALRFFEHQNPADMPDGTENAGNAAKVTLTGEVHLNNTLNDFYFADGSPNIERLNVPKVRATLGAPYTDTLIKKLLLNEKSLLTLID